MGGEKIGRKTVVSIIILVILLSSAYVYIIHDTEDSDNENENNHPINSAISRGNISAKTAFSFAEKVALEWNEDALLNKCEAPYKSYRGNSSMWQFEFYSPSSEEHSYWPASPPMGPSIMVHQVECEYLTVSVNINGNIESESSHKSFVANYPTHYSNWNIDSYQAFQIVSTNENITARMYNKNFQNTLYISFLTDFNIQIISVGLIVTECEVVHCYISPVTGEIIESISNGTIEKF